MKSLKKYSIGLFLALALVFGIGSSAAQAQTASSLTSAQISSIIGLLQVFGADQSVINNVQTVLDGGTPSGATSGSSSDSGSTTTTGPIIITNVQYSPTTPIVNQYITATVTISNESSTDYDSSFEVDVGGTTVTVPSLAAGAQTVVSVPNAFSYSTAGTYPFETVIIYPIGNTGSGNTGSVYTSTVTFIAAGNSSNPISSVPTPGFVWTSSDPANPNSIQGQLQAQGETWTEVPGTITAGAYVEDTLEGRLNQPEGRGAIGKVLYTAVGINGEPAAMVDFGNGYQVGIFFSELSLVNVTGGNTTTSGSVVTAVNNAGNPATAQGLIWVYWPTLGPGYTYTVSASPSYPGSVEKTTYVNSGGQSGTNMGCWANGSVCYNGGGPFPANGPYTFTVTATSPSGVTTTVGTSNPEVVVPSATSTTNASSTNPTVTITSPTAGQTINFGSPMTINWTTSGITGGTVGIYLQAQGGLECSIGSANALTDTFTVTLQTNQACPGNPYFTNLTAGKYQAYIDAAPADGIEDTGGTSGVFTIGSSVTSSAPTVSLSLQPGTTLSSGSNATLTWASSGAESCQLTADTTGIFGGDIGGSLQSQGGTAGSLQGQVAGDGSDQSGTITMTCYAGSNLTGASGSASVNATVVSATQASPASGIVSVVNHSQNSATAQGLIYISWPSQGNGYTYTVTANPSYPGNNVTTTSTGVNMGCVGSYCYNGTSAFSANVPYTFTVTATNAKGTSVVGTSNPELVAPATSSISSSKIMSSTQQSAVYAAIQSLIAALKAR